jgi:hypothetical protein
MTWYVLLDCTPQDALEVKRLFAASAFNYEEIDGKFALNAPVFDLGGNKEEVIAAAMELATSINTALRLSVAQFSGLMFWGIVEMRSDGTIHRTFFAKSGSFEVRGFATPKGAPVRTREERLVSLVGRMEEVADLAIALTPYPLTWGAMSKTYESVVGLMSAETNVLKKRQDFEGLIDRGWLTREESNVFYATAAFHRHGYPKTPVRGGILMDHTTAQILVKKCSGCWSMNWSQLELTAY